jgi:extracellular matrix regulatory protein A
VRIVNIGYGNIVAAARIIAVVSPDSAPMKRLKEDARTAGKLVDATQGRRTRSIILTDSDHVILSALQSETVAERLEKGTLVDDAPKEGNKENPHE